jgi:hypothetical protein
MRRKTIDIIRRAERYHVQAQCPACQARTTFYAQVVRGETDRSMTKEGKLDWQCQRCHSGYDAQEVESATALQANRILHLPRSAFEIVGGAQ